MHLCGAPNRLTRFGPGFGSDLRDLVIGHVGQTRKHFAQIGIGVNTAPTTTLDDGVDDGAALAGISFSNKEPVFLSYRGRANGVFYAEVPIMPRSCCRGHIRPSYTCRARFRLSALCLVVYPHWFGPGRWVNSWTFSEPMRIHCH
jgi:hypothetical protein